jgi:hypothetical protein
VYFSEAFGISRQEDDDWFDPILQTDTRLFVDPFLVFQDQDLRWQQAYDQLMDHFNLCFQLIADSGKNPRALSYRKALGLLRFPEPREFCLGYTSSGTSGAGGGEGYARLIAEAMEDAIKRGLQDLRHFEELGVLNEGIGPDRISDLTCNVLRGRFVAYTQEVAKRHSLKTHAVRVGGVAFDAIRQNWRSEVVQLPLSPASRRPILLLPARFLRELPTLNADDWWENYEAQQLRNDLNYEVMRNVRKRDIVAAARRHPELVRAWSLGKEEQRAVPYDFARDPLGLCKWLEEARRYVEAQPLVIPPPQDEDSFVRAIQGIVQKYRHFVEEEGGWRLLWNDGSDADKPEEAAQLLFKGIAQCYCEANNIVLDREVNLGRGPVDFKFSNGYARRALLEVKKLHNGQFWNGLSRQLPSYLGSDNCKLGWFVVIQYRKGGASDRWITKGPEIVRACEKEHGVRLRTVTIDARPKLSASQL